MSEKPLVMGAAGEAYQIVVASAVAWAKQRKQKHRYQLALNRKFKPKRRPTR